MKLLIDTSILIFYLEENKNELDKSVFDLIDDCSNQVYVSYYSLHEIAIKTNKGSLKMKYDFNTLLSIIEENKFKIIYPSLHHLSKLLQVTNLHDDPFDLMIISIAIFEKLTVISSDGKFNWYRKQGLSLIEN